MLIGVIHAAEYFVLSSLVVFIFFLIDDLLVPAYVLWDEIRKGNIAVALATGGKMIGLGFVTMSAIQHNETVWMSMLWTAIGGVLLLAGYFVFELATPRIAVSREIAMGNRAVGLVSMCLSIGLGLIIGACIT